LRFTYREMRITIMR